MRKAVKEKWLKALRSGGYKQTQGCLKDENGYCCLGVLCDIHSKTIKEKGYKFLPLGDHYRYLRCGSTLPEEVQEWSNLIDRDGVGAFKYKNGKSEDLASLNDSGKSFKQIANIIEKYF